MRSEDIKLAKLVVRKAFKNYGRHGFRVDPRKEHWKPLKDAERRGWVRWVADDRCGLTEAGVTLAVEYQGEGGGHD